MKTYKVEILINGSWVLAAKKGRIEDIGKLLVTFSEVSNMPEYRVIEDTAE